jgi:uncharacterized membrane protein YagU involved in acid resistance
MQAQANFNAESASPSSTVSKTVLRAILIGGAAVGVLDATDGVVWAAVTAGQNPIQVLQWIATGILGPHAFEGGLAAAGLGALIHFAISYGFTAAFVVAWTKIETIRKNWIAFGLAWGVLVWAFMNLIVLPNSSVPIAPLTVGALVNGIVGHAVTVGLAAAYVSRRVLATK